MRKLMSFYLVKLAAWISPVNFIKITGLSPAALYWPANDAKVPFSIQLKRGPFYSEHGVSVPFHIKFANSFNANSPNVKAVVKKFGYHTAGLKGLK